MTHAVRLQNIAASIVGHESTFVHLHWPICIHNHMHTDGDVKMVTTMGKQTRLKLY